MKLFRLMVVLGLVVVGLMNRRHSKHEEQPKRTEAVQVSAARTAVDQEIVKNAERLSDTLRRCKESARKTKEIN